MHKDDERAARDIGQDVETCFDLLYCERKDEPNLEIRAPALPHRYRVMLEKPDTYRLTVAITADGTPPARASVVVTWDGHWDGLKVV